MALHGAKNLALFEFSHTYFPISVSSCYELPFLANYFLVSIWLLSLLHAHRELSSYPLFVLMPLLRAAMVQTNVIYFCEAVV